MLRGLNTPLTHVNRVLMSINITLSNDSTVLTVLYGAKSSINSALRGLDIVLRCLNALHPLIDGALMYDDTTLTSLKKLDFSTILIGTLDLHTLWDTAEHYQKIVAALYRSLGNLYRTLVDMYKNLKVLYRSLINLHRTLAHPYTNLKVLHRSLIILYKTPVDMYKNSKVPYRSLIKRYKTFPHPYTDLKVLYKSLKLLYKTFANLYKEITVLYRFMAVVHESSLPPAPIQGFFFELSGNYFILSYLLSVITYHI